MSAVTKQNGLNSLANKDHCIEKQENTHRSVMLYAVCILYNTEHWQNKTKEVSTLVGKQVESFIEVYE